MLIILNTAVRKLFYLWFFGAVFLLIVVLVQIIFGVYGDENNSAWWWLITKVLPANLLVLFGYIKHRGLLRILTKRKMMLYRSSIYLSVAYLTSVILVLLLQPFINEDKSSADRLHDTDTGLFLVQALVLVILALFFHKIQKISGSVVSELLIKESQE